MSTARRWLPAVVVALVASGAGVIAVDLADDRVPAVGAPSGDPAPLTPVLSVRRVPELTGTALADRRLVDALDAFVEAQDADVCLEVRDDAVIRFAHRSDVAMVPASTQKLLTAVAALLTLGPDATFETTVLGPTPTDGVVAGDLFLVGGGDPLLATDDYLAQFRRQPQIHSDLEALADEVVAAGVRVVVGGVVGDESRYDSARSLPVPEIWMPEDLTRDVAGPLSALHVDDGFVGYPGDGSGTVTFDEAPDPAAHAAGVLTELLRDRGVVVAAEGRSGTAPAGAPRLAVLSSPSMATVVAQMLQESDNSTAELLVKELGRATAGTGSSAAGTAALVDTLHGAGFDLEGTTVLDGSGVANGNRTTCRLLGQLLTDDRVDETVVDGLAVAGESGTLANRFTDTPLDGRLRAKTGTLRIVTALAGEIEARLGDRLQFAYLVNVAPGSTITGDLVAAQELLGAVLFAYPDRPAADVLGPTPPG